MIKDEKGQINKVYVNKRSLKYRDYKICCKVKELENLIKFLEENYNLDKSREKCEQLIFFYRN